MLGQCKHFDVIMTSSDIFLMKAHPGFIMFVIWIVYVVILLCTYNIHGMSLCDGRSCIVFVAYPLHQY